MALYLPPLVGAIGLVLAFFFYLNIAKRPGGEGRIAEIAGKIQRGAMVFMRREFLLISTFAIIIGICLFFFQEGAYSKQQCLSFFLGAIASSFAGFVGMITQGTSRCCRNP